MVDHEPIVSCLCITRGNPVFLERAIRCFESQTYKNKELVLVYESDDENIEKRMNAFCKDDVFAINAGINPKLTLGELRNIAIQSCTGEYFCQWDDDDWHHRERIEVQLRFALKNHKKASLLLYWLIYDALEEDAYVSFMGPWSGSLLCKKELITADLCYPKIKKSEDAHFTSKLYMLNCVYPIVMPALYIYVVHGNNTWERPHFMKLFKRSHKLPKDISIDIKAIIEYKYSDAYSTEMLCSKRFLQEIDYLLHLKPKRNSG